jgi:uncharacterized membrane protein
MASSDATKVERVTERILLAIMLAVVAVLAVWSRSLLSIGFAVFVFTVVSIGVWRKRKLKLSEEEQIRRIDQAMGKPSDDPRQMSRWVP